jgi:hypothetical protein
MTRNSNSLAVVKTESEFGGTDRATHKVTKGGAVARKKLAAISSQVKTLRRQLRENTEGLECATATESPRPS